jgi:lipoprotein-anchoring transpeptidase ErfK/SrfK
MRHWRLLLVLVEVGALFLVVWLPTLSSGTQLVAHAPTTAPQVAAVQQNAGATTTTVVTSTVITSTVTAASNQVATLPGNVQGYAAPGGAPTQIVPGSWLGAVSELPVIATAPGWLEVRLAQRPNESTTWIQSTGIALTTTPYRIVVDLATEHLELFDEGQLVLNAPAGIGTPTDPTPTGTYFVALFAQAPDPGYGPFVIMTSDHSDAIADWDGSGDAVIAIHGPIGADAEIGTTGTAISHGCIRLHDSDLAQLRTVLPGSLVDIID